MSTMSAIGTSTGIGRSGVAQWTQQSAFSNSLSNWGFSVSSQYSAQYYNEKTYITYAGWSDNPYVIYYDHILKAWSNPVKVGTNPLANGDWHGSPSLLVDSSGYIHVVWGAHGSAVMYSKSTNAEDISSWTAQASPASGSYYQFFEISGKIYLFNRNLAGSYWGYKTSDDGGATWSATIDVIDCAYAVFTYKDGKILVTGCGFNTTGYDLYDLYFLYFDGTDWKDYLGNDLSLPSLHTDANIKVYESGLFTTPSVIATIDNYGNFCLYFIELVSGDGMPTGVFNYRWLRCNGITWDKYDIGATTFRKSADATGYDFGSGGTIYTYPITGGDSALLGGNVDRYKSTDNGITWVKDKEIAVGNFMMPIRVTDGLPTAKIVFAEYDGVVTNFNLKGYIFGNKGFIGNVFSPSTNEAETDALVTRMIATGEAPEEERVSLINTTIVNLKSAGLWSKFDCLWMIAAHGTKVARLNWIQDAYNLIQGSQLPVYENDRGATGDGSLKYYRTGFIPATHGSKYLKDDAAFGVYTRVNVDETGVVMGMRDASTYTTYIFTRDTNKAYGISMGSGTNITPANTDSRGLYILSRNAANQQNLYVRGSKTSNATASVKLETTEFYILAYNANGAPTYLSTNQVSFAFASSKLTDADVAAMNTIIVDGYLDSIGAKI